ncbi:MAG: putative ABC transport system permease protein [Chlamydiales bacterium]|jgi:putative ABC transport system permease protein
MGLALLIAGRSLFQRPGRTLFSMLGIALGIATVVGVITLDMNTILGLARPNKGGRPDLELRPLPGKPGETQPTTAATAKLGTLEGVSLATAFFQNDAAVYTDAAARAAAGRTPKPSRVRLFALEADVLPQLNLYRLLDGRDLDPASDPQAGEVLIGQPLADDLGLDLGDRLWVSRAKRLARSECIGGKMEQVHDLAPDEPVAESLVVVGILARESLGYRSRGQVVIVDFELGKRLFDGVRIQARYWGRRDPNVDIERLKSSLSATYSLKLEKNVILGQAADERAFRTGVRMTGLLALVLGLYVIFHTLSMSLTERVTEVATLHALGVTRRGIAGIFLFEAVLLAGGGALLGLAGGLGLARGLLALGITTLGTGKEIDVFVIPWGQVLTLSALGFGMALIGSVYPLSRIGRTSTAAALRGEGMGASGVSRGFQVFFALLLLVILPGLYFVLVPVLGEFTAPLVTILLAGVGFLATLIAVPLLMPSLLAGACTALARPLTTIWPLAGQLAARAMSQSPTRIAVSASAIALVAGGLVGLKGMTRSLRGEVEVWAQEALKDKVFVKDLPDVNYEQMVEHLAAFPGVIGVERGSARAYDQFLLIGIDADGVSGFGPMVENPALVAKLSQGRGMILSRRLARDLDYGVGDHLYVTKADGDLVEFNVIAVTDAYGYFPHPDERMYGVVAEEAMSDAFCLGLTRVRDLVVRLGPGGDAGVVEAAVRDFLVGKATDEATQRVHFEVGADLRTQHVEDVDRDFVLFDILIGLTAALAALGVLNGQLLTALERSKEIGVLKALGTSRRQVAGMVLLEALVIGLAGGAVGCAMGAGLVPLVVKALEELAGLALPQLGAGPWVPLALAGSCLLTVLAGLYPIWRMNRFDAVRAVRTG